MMEMPSQVAGLTESEQEEFTALVQTWSDTHRGNALRMKYYLGKNKLKDLGISIPPSLKKTTTVIGWPAKAVDLLAARSMFDGFVTDEDDEDPLGLQPILDDNGFEAMYEQAVRSQLIHCVAFWTVTVGDPEKGEPDVLISMRDATFAAALWDHRKRRIRSGLAIDDVDQNEPRSPTMITLYLDDFVITCEREKTVKAWKVTGRLKNPVGRPLMEPMAFLPDFYRPFGRSRISPEVMSITDSAQRGALRAEVLMEANTAPQKLLLGVEDNDLDMDKWTAYITSILAISKDEEGDTPSVMQLPQLTPQGAITYMQHLAMRMAGATGVPVSSLGVVHENPSSAQAILAAKDDLVTIAQSLNRSNRISLANVAKMCVALRDRIRMVDLPPVARSVMARFRNPGMPSLVSQADGMTKMISVIPWLADTEVALEEFGMDEGQIRRLMSARRRAESKNLLEQLLKDPTEHGERVPGVIEAE